MIETVNGRQVMDGGTYDWRDHKRLLAGKKPKPGRAAPLSRRGIVDLAFLTEDHHRYYGRPWALGRYIFELVLARGLLPGHHLLDFGCGSLRFGRYAIEYLDPGHYFGVDAHLKSLEAAAAYEIPLAQLEPRRPRLLWDADYRLDHFGLEVEWVTDISTSLHVPENHLPRVFEAFASVLAPHGKLLVSPTLRPEKALLRRLGLEVVAGGTERCPLLEGHDFDSALSWLELSRRS